MQKTTLSALEDSLVQHGFKKTGIVHGFHVYETSSPGGRIIQQVTVAGNVNEADALHFGVRIAKESVDGGSPGCESAGPVGGADSGVGQLSPVSGGVVGEAQGGLTDGTGGSGDSGTQGQPLVGSTPAERNGGEGSKLGEGESAPSKPAPVAGGDKGAGEGKS